jgi:TolB-like protein
MQRLRFGALTVLLSLCSLESMASAEDGAVAVLPFQGFQASKVRQGVQRGLRAAEVRLVPLEQVSAVVKKTKGFAKQAAKLEANVLVRARVRLVEGRFIAETEVLDAKGKRVDKLRTQSSSVTRLANRIVSQLMETGLMPVAASPKDVAQQPPAADAVPAAEVEPPTLPRLVVRPFTGVQSTKIRNAAVRGLRDEKIELFPNEQFVQKAGSLGADLGSDAGQVTAAEALGVSALVDGDVSLEDGMWSAYLRLVDGESAAVISQHFYEASSSTGLARAVEAKIGSDFRKDIEKLGVQAHPEVVVVPVPAVTAAPAAQAAKGKEKAKIEYKARPVKEKRPAAVDVGLDFRLVHRNFTYNDDLRGDLRDYTLKIGPGVGTKLQYYPGAHFTAGVGAQFGIDFAWEYLFKFDSKRADGETFPTESQQFLVGLRWRYPTGRWEPFVVADYGVHKFEFGVSGPAVPGEDNTAGIPGVKYEFVRIGGGVRVGIGKKERFIVAMDAAFRGVFSLGGIGTSLWFPQAKAAGMDAMLMLGYALPKGFEVRIGGDYRRYWLDLNPVPPDPPYVAGGALDQYWGGSIGVAWRR